ncbi:hypothetical protein GP5015_1459 [gamma proteobacterium HTCC5015]|nr:hypothetical protein GP5015_1459 [gamma proteobacterium HTCC5015]
MNKEKIVNSEITEKNDDSELLLEFLFSSQESARNAEKYPESELWLSARDVGREIID